METLILAIIEDEDAHFNLMKRSIDKEFPSASIYHFHESGTCLEQITQINPTIIITDYLLPDMNGVEFLEVLYEKNIDIPVIMVTGQGDEFTAVHALKLGAKDYLVKSGDFFTLLPSVIEKVVREKKMGDALRETEAKYRLVVENANEGILVLQDGNIQFTNSKMIGFLGYAKGKPVTGAFENFVYPEDKDIILEHYDLRKSGTKTPELYDFRIVDKNHDIRWLRNNEVVVDWEGKPATLNILTDITEQKRADEQIRILRQKLMSSQEDERHMISRELHDSIAQELSSLKIGWETLFDGQENIPGDVKQKAGSFSDSLLNIIKNVRDLSYLLSPSGLDQLGLVQSISQYCEDMTENTHLKVNVISAGLDVINLAYNTKINLYRIALEGFNNIRKHAKATQATIKIVSAYPNIILTIEDDGKGFDVKQRLISANDEKRMGLQSMQERAMLLGGSMMIQSHPRKGTKITVKIPIKEQYIGSEETRADYR